MSATRMLNSPPLSEVDKPLITLYSMGEDCVGLIILCQSGVVYTNQTGGLYCLQPCAEGVFMPIGDREQQSALVRLFGGGASSSINEQQANQVDHILLQSSETRLCAVDRQRLSDSHESWVFLRLAAHPKRYPALPIIGNAETYADPNSAANQSSSPIFGFGQAAAILTWPNSD